MQNHLIETDSSEGSRDAAAHTHNHYILSLVFSLYCLFLEACALFPAVGTYVAGTKGWSQNESQTWDGSLDDLEKLLSEWPQHLVASWPPCEPFGFISKRPFVFYGVPSRPVSCCVFAVPSPPECGRTTNPNSGYKLQTCLWRGSVHLSVNATNRHHSSLSLEHRTTWPQLHPVILPCGRLQCLHASVQRLQRHWLCSLWFSTASDLGFLTDNVKQLSLWQVLSKFPVCGSPVTMAIPWDQWIITAIFAFLTFVPFFLLLSNTVFRKSHI